MRRKTSKPAKEPAVEPAAEEPGFAVAPEPEPLDDTFLDDDAE